MTSRHLLLATLTLTATTALAADPSGTFDRTLTVSGTPTVLVRTGSGYVHVTPGSDNQFHVTGHVHANNNWFGGDAEARVKQIVASPPIVQTGADITVGPSSGDSDLYHNISIDYDVTTPRSTALKVRSGSGSLEITGIQGKVDGGTGSGSIRADNLGPNAALDSGSGSIHASNLHGAATLASGSGDLELSVTAPGDVSARAGSGSIHITGVTGALRATSGSGSIEATGNPTAEWRLSTGSGSIRLNPDPAAHFTLNADTGSGTVHVDRPIVMQGSFNPHHVSGTVNGGGPTLRASTGSGSVTVH